jgi:hypothetical protein
VGRPHHDDHEPISGSCVVDGLHHRGSGVCGIHQLTVESGNLDQLTNTMQSFMMEYLLRENNLLSVEKSRNRVTLSSGQPGLEVVVDLVPVARSSRLFVGPFRGRFYLIDCESYVVNWSLYEDSFKAIQKSFRLSGV